MAGDSGMLKDNIRDVAHLGILCGDLEQTREWYERTLGFTATYEKEVFYPDRMRMLFMELGNLCVEFVRTPDAASQLASRGTGALSHFAMDAPDFDNCVRRVLEAGAVIDASTPDGPVHYARLGEKGVNGLNIKSPNGEVAELCQDCSQNYGGRTGLRHWCHLAVEVVNLEHTVEFYKKLGFVPDGGGYVDSPQGIVRIGFVRRGAFALELIQRPGNTKGNDGPIDHIAFWVEDAKEAFAQCRMEGFERLDMRVKELPIFEHGLYYFMIRGINGEKIEFCQKKKW